MNKQEFLTLCDHIFRDIGFAKHGKAYYLDLGSDIVGSIYFQSSCYGKTIYINCGFSLKNYNDQLPYPKYCDTNMDSRIAIPGKEKLSNKPDAYRYLTNAIKYEHYNDDEIETGIINELKMWVIPAIRNGLSYILVHEEYYGVMVRTARILGRIPE